jgi:hypothetical protein
MSPHFLAIIQGLSKVDKDLTQGREFCHTTLTTQAIFYYGEHKIVCAGHVKCGTAVNACFVPLSPSTALRINSAKGLSRSSDASLRYASYNVLPIVSDFQNVLVSPLFHVESIRRSWVEKGEQDTAALANHPV